MACNAYGHPPTCTCGFGAAQASEVDSSFLRGLTAVKELALTGHKQAKRVQTLLQGGYVEPTVVAARVDPSTTDGINEDWAARRAAAEFRPNNDGVPVITDAYDPNYPGAKGLNRVHRMAYKIGGHTMRAPSAKYVKWMGKMRGTVDIPLTVETPGGARRTFYVRATYGGPGNWAVSPLGSDSAEARQVAIAYRSTLEAQRVTALPQGAAYKPRVEVVPEKPLKGSWMGSVGYDDDHGIMVMKVAGSGRTYGYSVDRATFNEITSADSPGAVFNRLVKFQGHDQKVEECARCRGIYLAARGHKCAPKHADLSNDAQSGRAHLAEQIKRDAEQTVRRVGRRLPPTANGTGPATSG